MSFAELITEYKVIDEHGTVYRLRPNPDVYDGFGGGAYIGWYDTDSTQADKNEIFISPDALRAVSEAFKRAADEAESKS